MYSGLWSFGSVTDEQHNDVQQEDGKAKQLASWWIGSRKGGGAEPGHIFLLIPPVSCFLQPGPTSYFLPPPSNAIISNTDLIC